MAGTALTLQPKPAGHREQLKQGSSKAGCGSSECVVGGTLAKVDQVPLGFGVPNISARSNISCTIVPSVARPKPHSSSAAQIRTASKISS